MNAQRSLYPIEFLNALSLWTKLERCSRVILGRRPVCAGAGRSGLAAIAVVAMLVAATTGLARPSSQATDANFDGSGEPAPVSQSEAEAPPATLAERLAVLADPNVGWREAFAVGDALTALPPDEGYAMLEAAWPSLPVEARQQMLKAWQFATPYPLHARLHPRLLDVMNLGMTDASPNVQSWATGFLRGVAFFDFAEDFPAYETWYAANRKRPLLQVMRDECSAYVQALSQAAGPQRQALARVEIGHVFRDVLELREIAVSGGVLDAFARWMEDPTLERDAERRMGAILPHLDPPRDYLESVVLPAARSGPTDGIRSMALRTLGKPQNKWAVKPLTEIMVELAVGAEEARRPLLWDAARALAELDDPQPISTMIELIAADNSYDTVYGIGYFGLGKLTGVQYDESHDGAWWAQWWEKNKGRYVEQAAIPPPQLIPAGQDAVERAAPENDLALRTYRTRIDELDRQIADLGDSHSGESARMRTALVERRDLYAAEIQLREAALRTNPLRPQATGAEDVADVPSQDIKLGQDDKRRYFLIGPAKGKEAPKDGYKLLLVLPGGDGSADSNPFVRRIFKNALPDGYLVAQLVAPKWRDDDNRIVWPTKGLPDEQAKFSTEEFVAAVMQDVAGRHRVDAKHTYALGWSSGGPAVYAAAMTKDSPLTGAFVAMSVYKPDQLLPAENAKGRAFYLLHSPQDFIKMTFPEAAQKALSSAGAVVKLETYEGGHGWHGDVFGMIRTGVKWLEEQQRPPLPPPAP